MLMLTIELGRSTIYNIASVVAPGWQFVQHAFINQINYYCTDVIAKGQAVSALGNRAKQSRL